MSLIFALKRDLSSRDATLYVAAQILGGVAGTIVAHLMFALPVLELSTKVRSGGAQWFAEWVATFGLVTTILAGIRFERSTVPCLVGLYITAVSADWAPVEVLSGIEVVGKSPTPPAPSARTTTTLKPSFP